MRTAQFGLSLFALPILLATGCGKPTAQIQETQDRIELTERDKAKVEEQFLERDLVTMELVRLNRPQLAAKIKHHVEMLQYPGWEYNHAQLLIFGKSAVPFLINALDRTEFSSSGMRPRFGAEQRVEQPFQTLGDVAHYVLMDLVLHATRYRADIRTERGELPVRDRKDWLQWYRRYGKSL